MADRWRTLSLPITAASDKPGKSPDEPFPAVRWPGGRRRSAGSVSADMPLQDTRRYTELVGVYEDILAAAGAAPQRAG